MKAARRSQQRASTGLALLSCLAVAVIGCSSMGHSVGNWFGATASPTPEPTPEASVAGVFYAGADGLTVYSDASSSSKVVGRLPLYDRVTRTKLERGYAYVTSAQTAVTGWVNNAQLLWRVPSSASAVAPRVETTPTVEPPEPTPTRDEAPPPPQPTATPATGVAPSIFDAY